jgi:aminoglycoside 6'-N-acetyltransferase
MIHVRSAQAAAPVSYDFRAMRSADLVLVGRWLDEPHVTRWWPDGAKQLATIARHLEEPSMRCLILTLEGRDVGYLQVYDPHHEPCLAPDGTAILHPYRDQPMGTRGIDLFIGEVRLIGRGHGPRLVAHVLSNLFNAGAPCVVTDPDPANTHSIAAFRKAGFRALETRDTEWGHVLLMRCDNPERAPAA